MKITTARLLLCTIVGGMCSAFAQEKKDDVVVLEKFVTEGTADVSGVLPSRPTNSVFGFDKSLVDTPRAITIVTSSMMENSAVKSSSDFIKVAPATYSNFRFGLEGNLSIRNQASDFYFRGMKRIDPQGNFRTVYTANDSLEIVEGPASPIFGLGKIGGYVNFNPKTGRAGTGKYLENDTGSVKVTYGSFDKKVVSGDVSGPIKAFGKDGGYSVYGYVENSGGWQINGFHQDQILQATFTVDLTKSVRLETGTVLQHSYGGLPGGMNRTTNDTIPTQTYWRGGGSNFTYHIDENGDGKISEREIRDAYFGNGTPQISTYSSVSSIASPYQSGVTLSRQSIGASAIFNAGVNETFFRVIPWQGGAVNGGTITADQFNAGYTDTAPTLVGGQPVHRNGVQLMVYPTIGDGNVYPKGSPGQIPNTNAAKQAFYLSPVFDITLNGWYKEKWNKRMSLGEDYYRANIGAFYFDLVNDYDPEKTFKNQVFVDTDKQIKDGSNGFSQFQQPTTVEDKFTFTKKFKPKSWWDMNFLASANVYQTNSYLASNSGDLDLRRDLQSSGNNIDQTFTANDRFVQASENRTYEGSPISSNTHSQYTISGVGIVMDHTFFNKLNLVMGGRWDYIDAKTSVPAGLYARSGASIPTSFYLNSVNGPGPSTNVANSGLITDQGYSFKGNSNGGSSQASLTYLAPLGIRPYITVGKQTISLAGTGAQTIPITQVKNALLGQSTLLEAGLKGSIQDTMFYSFTAYDQTRASFDPLTTVSGGPSSTISRGYEAQIRWKATKQFSLTMGGAWTKQKFQQGGNIPITGRQAGFPDVVDSTGKVIIPAEAFGFGGRLSTTIPDSDPRFRKVPGIPDHVVTVVAAYQFDNGYFIQGNMLNKGQFPLDRMATIIVPQTYVFDAAIGLHKKKWDLTVNFTNLFNRGSYGDNTFLYLLNPDHPQAIDATITRKF